MNLTLTIKILPSCVLRSTLCLSILCASALQAEAAKSGNFTYTVAGGKATVTRYVGAEKVLNIPSELNGLPVVGFDNAAFRTNTILTSVTIPKSVTRIPRTVFSECSSLTEIVVDAQNSAYSSKEGVLFNKGKTTLIFCAPAKSGNYVTPSTVTNIERRAFRNCSNLTDVTISVGVTTIEIHMFTDCVALKSVTIPTGVTSIGSHAFSGCSSLTNVTIPASVSSIGFSAFSDCTSLPNVTIPTGVSTIQNYTFFRCLSLKSVTIPNSVTIIEHTAFDECRGLINVNIPNSVTSIAFTGCSSLTNVAIPNSAISLVFTGCSSLTNVTIPNSVKFIYFRGCSSLTSVTIPASVTSITEDAFSGCSSLSEITVDEQNSIYSSEDGVLCNKDKTRLLECPEGKVGNFSIPGSVTRIEDSAFAGCGNVTSVTIPNSVTTIGNGAFAGCTSLTGAVLPESLHYLGAGVFSRCSSLTSIVLPASLPLILHFTFDGCSSLTTVTFKVGVTTGSAFFTYTFYGCYKIEDGAFRGCTSLKSLTMPSTLREISLSAFSGCISLKSVIIPASVVTIERSAFSDCASLSRVDFLGKTPFLGVDVFDNTADAFTIGHRKNAKGFDVLPWTRFKTVFNNPPIPWISGEIGAPVTTGSTIYRAGVFTQTGSGEFGNTTDNLHFSYQTLSGDGEIVARVRSQQAIGVSSRAGVMIRDSLAADSRHVFIGLTGSDSYCFVQRTTIGSDNATTFGETGIVPNTWLRLVRKGDIISAYHSTDGENWTLSGSTNVTLAMNCYVGLAVASGSDAVLSTSQFSNVKVKP